MNLKELRRSIQRSRDNGHHIFNVGVGQVPCALTGKQKRVIHMFITFYDEDEMQEVNASGVLEVHEFASSPPSKDQTPWYPKEDAP
tara:strand:+ start:99 stop:356 length:258 start_codon:yes stop_codon:yes gene_type:complete